MGLGICAAERKNNMLNIIDQIAAGARSSSGSPQSKQSIEPHHFFMPDFRLDKVIPLQVRCGPEGGWRYSSTLS